MNPTEFANRFLSPYRIKGEEIIPKYCPFCHGGTHNNKETFGLNINKLTYNCLRGSCNRQGTFYQLCKEFNVEADFNETRYKPKEYIKPKVQAKKVGNPIEKYFENRGISKDTIARRQVGQTNDNTIVLPYFENNELVLVKYRTIDNPSKHWREAGGKPVFWGMDLCNEDDPLVITEGEMDALALDECGIKNVVSVPSGSKDLECITNSWDWLQRFKKIIIWGDNDEPGEEMKTKIINRLGSDKCYLVHSQYKDANEHLINEGKESVIECFNNHREVPIEHINKLALAKDFDPTKIKTIKTGIASIDKTIGGLMLGHCSILSGKSGSGKSTLLNQVIANSVEQGYKSCIYSGELEEGLLRYWVELPIAGPSYISEKSNGSDLPVTYYLSKDVKEKIRKWYEDYLFYYDNTQSTKPEIILKKFEETYKRYNCKLFIIDNLMTMSFPGTQFEQLNAQSEFVGECIKFAQRYECHVIIVQHPVKTLDRITKDDIKGTGDITNRVSTVLLVHRLNRSEKEERGYDTEVEICKNRFNGKVDIGASLNFEIKSKRFYGSSDDVNKQYGWTKTIKDFIELEMNFLWNEGE